MNLTSVNPGDIVQCDVRGIKFYATVEETLKGELSIKPLTRHINHYHVKATQVVGHYKKMGVRR